MILRMTVPDETYEVYGTLNPKNPRKVMEDVLEKFKGVDPNKKAILFSGEDLSQLQQMLGGSFDSTEGVLEALRLALTIRVDGVTVELTPAQRKKLVTQAKAWNRPVDEFVEQQVRENLRSL